LGLKFVEERVSEGGSGWKKVLISDGWGKGEFQLRGERWITSWRKKRKIIFALIRRCEVFNVKEGEEEGEGGEVCVSQLFVSGLTKLFSLFLSSSILINNHGGMNHGKRTYFTYMYGMVFFHQPNR